MDTPESKVHSFIVKLWVEEAVDEKTKSVWRGYITHVPDGERRYLKRLSDITDFIARYLGEVGINPRLDVWFKRRLRRLNLRLTRRSPPVDRREPPS